MLGLGSPFPLPPCLPCLVSLPLPCLALPFLPVLAHSYYLRTPACHTTPPRFCTPLLRGTRFLPPRLLCCRAARIYSLTRVTYRYWPFNSPVCLPPRGALLPRFSYRICVLVCLPYLHAHTACTFCSALQRSRVLRVSRLFCCALPVTTLRPRCVPRCQFTVNLRLSATYGSYFTFYYAAPYRCCLLPQFLPSIFIPIHHTAFIYRL